MLVKEYRIILPLTVAEYRIAQLYMIQKKSRQESSRDGTGVEILTNEPYSDGPGGSGQYTFKIYHIGSKVPGWLRSVLPSSALEAHEEAWNAYPYTKTRYTCPLMDRFSVEVETKYYDDAGNQENVFELTGDELRGRIIDVMDFVNDNLTSSDYLPEEDPKLYESRKTGRGPLREDWIDDSLKNGKAIMCAYKLCKVEFRFWGLQTRAERWIQSYALRNTMLRAHRQAWVWQDEWIDLSLEDVRQLEAEVAEHLSHVMSTRSPSPLSESSSIYFDCVEGSPVHSTKPSMIKWSSELLLTTDQQTPPPQTPHADMNTSLLIFFFHGDIFPESPVEQKLTDAISLRSSIENMISSKFPNLKSRVHFLIVTCGRELSNIANQLISLSPAFGIFRPSLAILLSSSSRFVEAVRNAIVRANELYTQFLNSSAGYSFNGEIFAVGDYFGGLVLHECMKRDHYSDHHHHYHQFVSRHSSSFSTNSPVICEDCENERWPPANASSQDAEYPCPRNHSSSPSSSNKRSSRSMASANPSSQESTPQQLSFSIKVTILLGCPLAMVLVQRQLYGNDAEALDCSQLYNLYYLLDLCGARLEAVLNPQLTLLPPVSVPRFSDPVQDDTNQSQCDSSSVLDTSLLWGSRRIDHLLHCPRALTSISPFSLPNILHASYLESEDVAAFILRQFLRSDDLTALSAFVGMHNVPSEVDVGPPTWNKRRTRYKIANLSPSHRGNDVIVPEGDEQVISACFCYGPMDLVALSRENVSVFVSSPGTKWEFVSSEITDSHGRLTLPLKKRLPVGLHCVKLVVHGDHSFLDLFVAVAPRRESFVVFSFDGSLTGSVSVTGRDPKLRPGAVDVVRFWHDLGYTIIYITARPDMQHKVVGTWLALHNFPHGLLFFAPSFSTDPLRQKTVYLKNLVDRGLCMTAAYGSSKDVYVYSNAGVASERIFSVSGSKRKDCVHIDSYASHLNELNAGIFDFAKKFDSSLVFNHFSVALSSRKNIVQRTHSFTPRSGRHAYSSKEK